MKSNHERDKSSSNKIITLPINLQTSSARKKYTGKETNSDVRNLSVNNLIFTNEDSGDEILSFYIPKGDRLSFATENLHQLSTNGMNNAEPKYEGENLRSKSENHLVDVDSNDLNKTDKNYFQSLSEDIKRNDTNSSIFLFEHTKRKISYENESTAANNIKAVKQSEGNLTDTFNDSLNYINSSLIKEGVAQTYERKKFRKNIHKRNLSENFHEEKVHFQEDTHAVCEGNNFFNEEAQGTSKNKLSSDKVIDLKKAGYFNVKNKEASHARTRSNVPFERIKEKLEDGLVGFLKKHRFSSVLTGNKKYEGKSGDYYLNIKKLDQENTNYFSNDGNHRSNNITLHNHIEQAFISNKNEKIERDSFYDSKKDMVIKKEDFSPKKSASKIIAKKENKNFNNSNHKTPINSSAARNQSQLNESNKKKILKNPNNKINKNEYSTYGNIQQINKQNQNIKNLTKNKELLDNHYINSNNYHTTSKQKPQKKSSFIFDIDQSKPLRGIEKIIGITKNAMDLTPIPTKNKKKIQAIEQEYFKAERAAVLIRRIEYSFGLKHQKEEMIKEANNFYYELARETNAVIIQRWWRAIKRVLEFMNTEANKIQKVFRGYRSRSSYVISRRQNKYVFPFIHKFCKIIRKFLLIFSFDVFYSKFAILAQKKFILQLIKLIQRKYRMHLGNVEIKRRKIIRSFFLIGKSNFSKYFGKIQNYDKNLNRVIKIQSVFRGINFRNDQKNFYRIGSLYHPLLFYFMKYGKDKLVYQYKKELFYTKFCKKFLNVIIKKKIPNFVQRLDKILSRISIMKYFDMFKGKLHNYSFFRIKVKLISTRLKSLFPIFKNTFKRKAFDNWKKNYFIARSKCRMCVKLFQTVFKIFLWKKLIQKIKKEEIKNNITNNLSRVINYMKKKILSIYFSRIKMMIQKFQKREKIISKYFTKKEITVKKRIIEKFKKNFYYYSYFHTSYKINKGVEILKILLMRNFISGYKNFMNLFQEQKKRTKLRKLFNIAKVYYMHKKKIHFEKFSEIAEKLKEIEFNKLHKLGSVYNRLTEKIRLLKKIKFLRFALNCFKKKDIRNIKNIATEEKKSGASFDKSIEINKGREILSNIFNFKLKEILQRLTSFVKQKENLTLFIQRLCFVAKANQKNQKLKTFYKIKNDSLVKFDLCTRRNNFVKRFLRGRISRSKKDFMSKHFNKWKLLTHKTISDNSNLNYQMRFDKIRNKMFIDLITRAIPGRIFKCLMENSKINLNVLTKSKKSIEKEKSCKCKQLNATYACEKLFIFRSNKEKKIKRIMFDKFKMVTGLLFINTYSIGSKMIFKRKVNKNEMRKKITKLLKHSLENLENIYTKKRLYYSKWKKINDNFNKNFAATKIQEFLRKKLSQDEEK